MHLCVIEVFMSGKGDAYRPVDREKYESNWDRIFANKQDRKPVKHSHIYDAMASQRCPNTIDIEEQIEQDRESE
jgi:hypothetical protein